MGICGTELLELIIRPTLKSLGVNNPIAERLMLGTAAVQSNLGFFLQSQRGIGLFGISSEIHQSIWDEYLAFQEDLASNVRGFASQHEFLKAPNTELASNLRYATAIAWMIYQRADIDLSKLKTDQDLAQCWYEFFAQKSAHQSPSSFIAQVQQIPTEVDEKAA
ncbi:MAG: hypothetical protein MI867_09610 [Pseudomonadales bacterium]|nr:hypothetical protein [Pseudomonadales bacterium]